MTNWYLGIMSGTSLDGIDVALVDADRNFQVIHAATFPLGEEIKQAILQLTTGTDNELARYGALDKRLAEAFAAAANQLLIRHHIPTSAVTAIGCHGQTLRHDPSNGFTLQAGDPHRIAALTGINVVADFRRKDVALDGQGAPLAPAFHADCFTHPDHDRVIVNIGGMANITQLPKTQTRAIYGYDTGPGNVLLDAWCQRHTQQPYDNHGEWAASGKINPALLNQLLSLPFFHEPPPKSTGREQFSLAWLDAHLARLPEPLAAADIQATLLELTACTISRAITSAGLAQPQVYLCGGGAHNTALLGRLRQQLPDSHCATTALLGVDPDWVEAVAFAWLAWRCLHNLPGNLTTVTGACRPAVLGAIYPS